MKYWEVGNEQYGNGGYGSPWETDHHSSHSATTYANHVLQYDPDNDATVSPDYSGFTPSAAGPTVYSYLKNAHSITPATAGSATRQTVPAYSVVVVQMHPADAACRVVYNKNEWPGGLIGSVTLTNNSLGQINGWDLGFNFGGDTQITTQWNATVKQSGPSINAGNTSLQRLGHAGRERLLGLPGHLVQQ